MNQMTFGYLFEFNTEAMLNQNKTFFELVKYGFEKIVEAFKGVFGLVELVLEQLIYFGEVSFDIIGNLPGYLAWLPASAASVLVSIAIFNFIKKVVALIR